MCAQVLRAYFIDRPIRYPEDTYQTRWLNIFRGSHAHSVAPPLSLQIMSSLGGNVVIPVIDWAKECPIGKAYDANLEVLPSIHLGILLVRDLQSEDTISCFDQGAVRVGRGRIDPVVSAVLDGSNWLLIAYWTPVNVLFYCIFSTSLILRNELLLPMHHSDPDVEIKVTFGTDQEVKSVTLQTNLLYKRRPVAIQMARVAGVFK